MLKKIATSLSCSGLLASGLSYAQTEMPAAAEPPPVLGTIPVQAGVAAEPPAKRAQDAPPEALEEVIVTATKRAANPRELPASIAALRGDDLEKSGAQGQEDFLKQVPGVTFSNDTINANRITIRGIGADLNTSNTTGVFFGDVPFEDPTLPRVTLDPNPFDLARVEVLKGPQGTLFGGSALNGAVRYVPQDPQLGVWEGKAYGQIEDVFLGKTGPSYGAALNVPIGDTFAARVMGFNRKSPGWVDDLGRGIDDVNEVKQYGGRAMTRWEPGENWKITAMAVFQKTKVEDLSITDNREGHLSRSNTPQASPVQSQYNLETLGIQYSFDTFDVLSQSSRTGKHFDGMIDASRIGNIPNPPPSVTITTDNQSHALMQELRFTSNRGFNDRWNWLGGVFYRKVHLTEVNDILASSLALPLPPEAFNALGNLIPGFNGIITEDGRIDLARSEAEPIDVTEMALFGETTIKLIDSLELTLGARAFRTESRSKVTFSGLLTATTWDPGTLQKVSQGELDENGINPKAALKYVFNRNLSVYTAMARGFRFGGPQVLVGTLTGSAPDSYKSDTIWSYEAGLRTQWLQDKLTFDVTAFQVDWHNPQLQQADATGLGSYFDNVGGARGRGVETAIRYLTPLPGLIVSFSGAYTNTVTTKPFTTSDGTDTEPGTRWPLAARWQTASTLSYQRPLFLGWQGGGSLLYATISKAPNTLAYLDTVFGYETLDVTLNAGNSHITGMPELSLTLSNATDERGIISGVNNPQFANDHNYIRPRTLIARLGFSF
jgi:iron complex outermembrane receptor protein